MRPAQFATRHVANLRPPIGLEELPEIPQVGRGEATAELLRQALTQRLELARTISRAGLARLFVLDDEPADLPIRLHHGLIDAAVSKAARVRQHVAHLYIKLFFWHGWRRRGWLSLQTPFHHAVLMPSLGVC